VRLYDLAMNGRHAEALALNMQLQALNTYLEYDPGCAAPAKEALNLLGLPGGCLRAPLPQLTAGEKAGVKAALKTIGLL
jgi:dihydrodipicolinate synthase/N-acetylneuraminate lyase